MKYKIIPKRFSLFIIATMLMAVSFHENQLGIIEDDFYKYWQEVSEFFVVGRLVKSQQDGVFSAGGLLVVGNADHYDVSGKGIRQQYDSYSRGEGFSTYWTYKSTPAMEGILYSIFDEYTPFVPGLNIKIFRASVAVFSAAILALLLVWIEAEFGFTAFLLSFLFACFSPWLGLFGGHIYWQMWSFFLPFTAILLMTDSYGNCTGYRFKVLGAFAYITLLLKILFSGFEFITPVLVSLFVPGIYFFFRDRWPVTDFLRWAMNLLIAGVLSILTGLLILLLQITGELGNLIAGYNYIIEALNRRSTGDPSNFTGVFAEALNANTFHVIRTYLTGPALAFDGRFTGGIYPSGIRYFELLLAFLFFSLLLFFTVMRFSSSEKRKAMALLTATWFAMFAPLSWFVIFKAHSYIHTNLDYFVWQLPFMFLGFALCGYTIRLIFTIISANGLLPTNIQRRQK